MRKAGLIVFLAFLSFSKLFAQDSDIFVPRNFLKAVEKGTRTLEGLPGINYWQNKAEYKIKANIYPKERILSGFQTITYYNNSPDTLTSVYFRLYQNIQKDNSPRDAIFSREMLTDGMKINYLQIEDKVFEMSDNPDVTESGTNLRIKLENYILPSSSVQIGIEWEFEIPKQTWRLGFMDSTSAFIAYWYPQISVYDDIDGWDLTEYKGYAEMYNDFNDFEVELTVPADFGVWATGLLQNPEDLLLPEYLQRYRSAFSSEKVVSIISETDLNKGNIFQNKENLTFKYFAEKVPDFAFGFSDHYLWDAVSLKLKNGSNVYVAAAYNSKSKDFYEVAKTARECLEYFSDVLPGIDYPFPSAVVFNGSGGMEFPMIVNNGSSSSFSSMVGLTAHELAHQYFPFYAGTNERKYAWMDEGWAVMFPFDYQERYSHLRRNLTIKAYEIIAGTEFDIPPIIPSFHLSGTSYRNAAYNRPGIAYMFLRDLMGDELFSKAIKTFINRWNGKHPLPYDFFFTFNETANEDLSWFWKPWFFDYSYPDLAINLVESVNERLITTIKKIGSVPVPVNLKFIYASGEEDSLYLTADIWKDGREETIVEFVPGGIVVQIELGNELIPDTDRRNNTYSLP